MKGIFYGVGVGPGDPDMITFQAAKAIESADIIAAPKADAGRSVAFEIASKHCIGKEILELYMPMTMDKEELDRAHDAAAQTVREHLEKGLSVAFLTLGDVSLYSTFHYLQKRIERMGYDVEIIPGIPALCAMAATLKKPLAKARQSIKIIPALKKDGVNEVVEALKSGDSVVVMKSGKRLGELKKALAESSLSCDASLVVNCTMSVEQIYMELSDAPDESGYFSTILIKP